MQVGSLVIMIKPFSEEAIMRLILDGFREWPVVDPNIIYIVSAIDTDQSSSLRGIQLYDFPEFARQGYWFNSKLFREIELPEIDFEKLFEQAKKKEPKRTLEPIEMLGLYTPVGSVMDTINLTQACFVC